MKYDSIQVHMNIKTEILFNKAKQELLFSDTVKLQDLNTQEMLQLMLYIYFLYNKDEASIFELTEITRALRNQCMQSSENKTHEFIFFLNDILKLITAKKETPEYTDILKRTGEFYRQYQALITHATHKNAPIKNIPFPTEKFKKLHEILAIPYSAKDDDYSEEMLRKLIILAFEQFSRNEADIYEFSEIGNALFGILMSKDYVNDKNLSELFDIALDIGELGYYYNDGTVNESSRKECEKYLEKIQKFYNENKLLLK